MKQSEKLAYGCLTWGFVIVGLWITIAGSALLWKWIT